MQGQKKKEKKKKPPLNIINMYVYFDNRMFYSHCKNPNIKTEITASVLLTFRIKYHRITAHY